MSEPRIPVRDYNYPLGFGGMVILVDRSINDLDVPVSQGNYTDAGFDIHAPKDIYCPVSCCVQLKLGLTFKFFRETIEDDGRSLNMTKDSHKLQFWGLILPRSSTGTKKAMRILNTAIVLDNDFNGPDDFMTLHLQREERVYYDHVSGQTHTLDVNGYNNSMKDPWFKKGEKIAQIVPVMKLPFNTNLSSQPITDKVDVSYPDITKSMIDGTIQNCIVERGSNRHLQLIEQGILKGRNRGGIGSTGA